MKYGFRLFSILFYVSLLAAQQLTMDDVFNNPAMKMKNVDIMAWYPDGSKFFFQKTNNESSYPSIYSHHVKSGKEELWLSASDLVPPGGSGTLEVDEITFTESGKQILIKANAKRIWRKYSEAEFYLLNLTDKKFQLIHNGKKRVRHAKISPDETYAAYVYGNNLYLLNLKTNQTKQITSDGNEHIINGQSDWVYEEEFGQDDAWSWSTDGKKIAFWRFDQSGVPEFSWTEFDSVYGNVRTIRYPKAGAENSIVQIGIYNVESDKTVWVDTGVDEDFYIPRIYWTKKPDVLLVQRLNRLQNKLDILLVDVFSGKIKTILTESDPCWVDIEDDLFFLKNNQFIRTSEIDGFRHIYHYDVDGRLIRQLTSGSWEVSRVYGVDEKNGLVFFSANKDKTSEIHLFSIKLNGKDLRKLSKEEGSHSAEFAPDFSCFIHKYSAITLPLQTELCRTDGTKIRTLAENKPDRYKHLNLVYPELLTFKTSDGVELNAMITKPADFDSQKKYPVLIYGYSGPASQLVENSWGGSTFKLWYTFLTQQGYIIFTLDQRGTGGRGKAFKNLAYGDIGKYMIRDHIEGIKYLSTLSYIETSRIGVWGWSGGGYLTLMALTKASDYFKAGVAVAPVSDYRLYDTIWTERYMGLPQSNAAGYDSSSALTYIDRYKGGLLIIHGASDDNVHLQNTMQFVELAAAKGKQMEMFVYPQRNHSMQGNGSVMKHLYETMTNFILEHL